MSASAYTYPYNPNVANPFIATGGSKEWEGNELILKDLELRKKARVLAMDECVTDVYGYSNAVHPPQRTQLGGGAVGAPFYIQNFGAENAAPYTQDPDPVQGFAPLPKNYNVHAHDRAQQIVNKQVKN